MNDISAELNLILTSIYEQSDKESHFPHISYGTLVNKVSREIPNSRISKLLQKTIEDGYVEQQTIERYAENDNPFGIPTANYIGYSLNGNGLQHLFSGGYTSVSKTKKIDWGKWSFWAAIVGLILAALALL